MMTTINNNTYTKIFVFNDVIVNNANNNQLLILKLKLVIIYIQNM